MNLEQHLIELSDAVGLSGFEGSLRPILREAWDGLADEFRVDALGSLIASLPGEGRQPRARLLVTAHMDEIGLIVSRVEGAFLRVARLGGVDRRVLLNQPVIVHGERPIKGLVGSRPPHVLTAEEREKFPAIEDVVVDTGLSPSVLKRLVPVGVPVSFDVRARTLGEGLVTGKALDNRAGVAALTLILENLKGRSHAWDALIAATIQEETVLLGGRTVAWEAQPDIAIVIDTTWALGAGVGEDRGFPLGGGPTITIGPSAHPKLFEMLRKAAEQHEIPLAVEPYTANPGAESWATQVTREGIPSALLSIPLRNMHTPVEIVALKDIERVARLVAEFVVTLDDQTVGKLALDAE